MGNRSMKVSTPLPYFSAEDIHEALTWNNLIDGLQLGFTKDFIIPPRMHLNYEAAATQNTLLLMPAVQSGELAGVKIVNVAPENANHAIPTIQGIYYLQDALTGEPKAIMDAKTLTNWRTAAASALAARYLAAKDARILLMVGTGSLAPFLIDAHASVRPIEKVLVYGRSAQKAAALAKQQSSSQLSVTQVDDLAAAAKEADIISVATMSSDPLIEGSWLRQGKHIDLVGSFKPTMREADDEVVRRSAIYVDSLEMALRESGDLAIPIKEGVIAAKDIRGDLFELCKEEVQGRQHDHEITMFKSVGHALEDLVAAKLIYQHTTQP